MNHTKHAWKNLHNQTGHVLLPYQQTTFWFPAILMLPHRFHCEVKSQSAWQNKTCLQIPIDLDPDGLTSHQRSWLYKISRNCLVQNDKLVTCQRLKFSNQCAMENTLYQHCCNTTNEVPWPPRRLDKPERGFLVGSKYTDEFPPYLSPTLPLVGVRKGIFTPVPGLRGLLQCIR